MAEITIQVLQGHEAGAVLRNLSTPITIGREEENEVQLNDERISRFHAKIQGNEEALILTDLDSTNGTRVNGHYTKMRVLQPGDQISMGRCMLVIGSPEEIAALGGVASGEQNPAQTGFGEDTDLALYAFPSGPPRCPRGLSTLQAAETANLVEFMRTEVLAALNQMQSFRNQSNEEVMQLSQDAWHRLQNLPAQLARYLEQLGNPGGSGE